MIIAIINMKGGVGKTTLAVNLSLGLAKYYNKKVLLVDLDPQFNATQYLMRSTDYLEYVRNKKKLTIKDIFVASPTDSVGLGDTPVTKEAEIKLTRDNCTVRIYGNADIGVLDLIPSRLELMEADVLDRGIENKLKIFLDEIKSAYDFILLDCPPTISLFTTSAFIAADSYLIPLKPDYLSSIGLSLIEKAVRKFTSTYGKKIDYLGLVFVMVQNTILMNKTMKTVRSKTSFKCFDSILSHTTRIAETVEDNRSIFDIKDNKGKYASEMRKIVDEFMKRVR